MTEQVIIVLATAITFFFLGWYVGKEFTTSKTPPLTPEEIARKEAEEKRLRELKTQADDIMKGY